MPVVATRRRVSDLVRRSRAGLDTDALRLEVLRRLRALLTIDAAFFATVDPATLLFTSAVVEAPLDDASALFLANEFATPDVNKFVEVARAPVFARSLDTATGHERCKSARYREIMAPLGLGDELRVVLRTGSGVWGVLCLHREESVHGFSDAEVELLQNIAPHVGAGLRRGVLLARTQRGDAIDEVGLVLLDASTLSVVSTNVAGERMMTELDGADGAQSGLPLALQVVAEHTLTSMPISEASDPSVRVCTRGGQWLSVRASVLNSSDRREQVAILIEPVDPRDVASLLLDAYTLTPRERQIAELVLRGSSTRQIVDELRISAYTVQDHLKSIFEKFGVGSRRELVGALLGGRHP